ncbi:hypothetical protein B7463_g4835, partial [Scytalidium lignicola]
MIPNNASRRRGSELPVIRAKGTDVDGGEMQRHSASGLDPATNGSASASGMVSWLVQAMDWCVANLIKSGRTIQVVKR